MKSHCNWIVVQFKHMDTNVEIQNVEERENLKNHYVILREQEDFESAVGGLKNVIKWDQENNNPSGELDVLGHLRIAYVNWAGATENLDEKSERIQQAEDIQLRALELLETHFPDDKARKAIVYAHLSDTIIEQLKMGSISGNDDKVASAFSYVQYSIENLGGSEAHKAWVFTKLAQLHYLANKDVHKALATLHEGEIALYNGYEEELKNSDGLMKIRVWKSGLWITYATICQNENRPELARMYAEAIVSLQDEMGLLNTRKEQAKKILSTLNTN